MSIKNMLNYSPDQLKRLTKEEKLELIKLAEARAAKKPPIRKFKPNRIQLKILQSTALYKICTAGNGSGKSTLGVQLAFNRAFGTDPWLERTTKVPVKIVVLVDTSSKIEDVWMVEARQWYDFEQLKIIPNKKGKPYVSELQFPNGSVITFQSWDQDLTTFESIQFDILIADEPLPRNIFIALQRGMRKKGVKAETLIIGTPVTSEARWLREEFIQPWAEGKLPEVECFTGSTKDNEANLDEGYIERFSRLLTDKERAVRLEGAFEDIDTLVFSHLIKKELHIVRDTHWNASYPCVLAIDPHPSKAHTAVIIGRRLHDNKLVVLREFSAKQTARQFASSLHTMMRGFKIIDIVCDSLGKQDGTGHEGFKSFIQVLNECGIRARATTYEEKSHEATVDRLRTLLDAGENFTQEPKLVFSLDTPSAFREVTQVSWQRKRGDEFNKPRLDYEKLDYFSCLAYGLATSALQIAVDYGIIRAVDSQARLSQNPLRKAINYRSSRRPMKRNYTYNRQIDED